MKITKQQLRRVIQEELGAVLREQGLVNEIYYDPDAEGGLMGMHWGSPAPMEDPPGEGLSGTAAAESLAGLDPGSLSPSTTSTSAPPRSALDYFTLPGGRSAGGVSTPRGYGPAGPGGVHAGHVGGASTTPPTGGGGTTPPAGGGADAPPAGDVLSPGLPGGRMTRHGMRRQMRQTAGGGPTTGKMRGIGRSGREALRSKFGRGPFFGKSGDDGAAAGLAPETRADPSSGQRRRYIDPNTADWMAGQVDPRNRDRRADKFDKRAAELRDPPARRDIYEEIYEAVIRELKK